MDTLLAADPWALLALPLVGLAAGFLNVLAGGGGVLTVPMLVFVGLPDTVANGTYRIAVLTQNASATLRFERAGQVDWPLVRRFAPSVLVGAGLGAWLGTVIDDAGYRRVFSVVMLVVAVIMAMPIHRWLASVDGDDGARTRLLGRPWLIALIGLLIGLYGGLIQAGVGYLCLGLLVALGRLSLPAANVLKIVLVAVYTPLALALFALGGKVELGVGLVLAGGQAVGAWLGARTAIERGTPAIRVALLVAVGLTLTRLLGLWSLGE